MPSPDISEYLDVTIYDKTPTEIRDAAIEYAREVLPEWTPHTGGVEDAILQASASMTSELAGSINRITAGAIEVLLQLLGITRDSGTQASGSLTITVKDLLGHTIPAGTRFAYRDTTDPDAPVLYTFDTDEDLVIAPSSNTGTVAISAVFYQEYPALEDGQALRLLTPTSSILSAVLAGDLTVGADPESDVDYFNRAIATLNSYSAAIALPDQFDHFVLSNYTDVYRCKTYSRVDSADDLISGWSPSNGFVTVYVSRVGGASLSTTAMTEIEEDLADHAVAGLDISVVPAHLDTVPVAVTITLKSGYSGLDVRLAVEEALGQYIDPDYWIWDDTIYVNEIVSLVDQVPGVDRVVSVTIDSLTDDYTFSRFGTLPIGDFDVSVT